MLTLTLTLSLLLPAHAEPNPAQGHCTAEEIVIFTCPVKGGTKHLSVCQSGGLIDFGVRGGLQYRFGPLGTPELRHPADVTDTALWSLQEVPYARSMATELTVTNGEFSYVVIVQEGATDHFVGVAVKRGGEQIATVPCEGPVVNNLDSVPALIRK